MSSERERERERMAAALVLLLTLLALSVTPSPAAATGTGGVVRTSSGDQEARKTSMVLSQQSQQWASGMEAGFIADAHDGRSSRSKRGRRTGLLDGKVRERRLFCEEFFRGVAANARGGGEDGAGDGGAFAPPEIVLATDGGEVRRCLVSGIMLENCMLECLSSSCYAEIYGQDALEEGEVDVIRSRKFRNCMRARLRVDMQGGEVQER